MQTIYNVNTIGSWLEFVDTLPPSSPDGSSTPDIPPVTVFGSLAQRIRDDVFHFLVVTLPEVLEVHTTPDSRTVYPIRLWTQWT